MWWSTMVIFTTTAASSYRIKPLQARPRT